MNFFGFSHDSSESDAQDFNRRFREIFCQNGISAVGITAQTPAGECDVSIRRVEGPLPNGNRYSAYVIGDESRSSNENIAAYWVPQGEYMDIPRDPQGGEPKFVFTPSFSGCTWVVDKSPRGEDYIRVHHVEGGKFDEQYTPGASKLADFSTLSAKRWREYAVPENGVATRKASMFMAHEEGEGWVQYWQAREYTLGQGGHSAVGPHGAIEGHDRCVLNHVERVHGLLATIAASHSEQRRHGGLPEIQQSQTEFLAQAPSWGQSMAPSWSAQEASQHLHGDSSDSEADESRYRPFSRRGSSPSRSPSIRSMSSEVSNTSQRSFDSNESRESSSSLVARVDAFMRFQRHGR